MVAWTADAAPIRSRRGLVFLPDAGPARGQKSESQSESESESEAGSEAGSAPAPEPEAEPPEPTVELPRGLRPVETLDAALAGVADRYGKPTCDFVALQMEYPGGDGAGPCPRAR